MRKKFGDTLGTRYGSWEIQRKIDKDRYLCLCSCGNLCEVLKRNLFYGRSTQCSHCKKSK